MLSDKHPACGSEFARSLARWTLLVTSLLTIGCIPERTCEFTRTCAAHEADAASPTETTSGVTLDAAAQTSTHAPSNVDAAATSDADAGPTEVVPCVRSADCTLDLPYCDTTSKVCTACRNDQDCKTPQAAHCKTDASEPQHNVCVECLTGQTQCSDGVCVDDACVACDVATSQGCDEATPICILVDDAPVCVACESNSDCEQTPETPTCSDHRCKLCSATDATHCPEEQPVCVEQETSARCVECTTASECTNRGDGGAGPQLCVQERCTACVLGTNDGCSSALPFCAALIPGTGDAGVEYLAPSATDSTPPEQYLDYEHACLECLVNPDCGGSRPGCFEGQCVACTEDAHCKQPEASVCDLSTHTCTGCQAVGDCAHQPTTPACDIDNRRCVECTAAEDSCGDNACRTIPGDGQYTCSTASKGKTGPCSTCVSDSACQPNSKCVQEVYDGSERGFRCFWREADLSGGQACGDTQVFVEGFDATSVDGAVGHYCKPRTTSCQGYRDYGNGPVDQNGLQTCLSHDDCGLPGEADGFCTPFTANTNLCTYACLSTKDCKTGLSCVSLIGVDNTSDDVCALNPN